MRAGWSQTAWVNQKWALLVENCVPASNYGLFAPLAATYPLVTVALSALMPGHATITGRIAAGTALAVAGVALILVG